MLAKYYQSSVLLKVFAAGSLLILTAFAIWYNFYTVITAPHWGAVLGVYILAICPIFLPTHRLELPEYLPPLIVVLGLSSVEMTLTAISHCLTFLHLSWPLMAYTALALGLILRRRSFYGWLFFIGFSILVLSKHTRGFDSRLMLATEFIIPVLLMLIAMIVPRQIEQANSKTQQARGMRIIADADRAEKTGIGVVSSQRVQEVRALTEDMLYRIAYNQSPVTQDEMDSFRFAEAQLRDTIRGRYIVNRQILDTAWLARQRGVKVDILDERGSSLPGRVASALTHCAVDLFENASSGTITIRAFPSDDPCAVMLVHDGNSEDDEPSAIEISQTGDIERF
ncbi:hypothetical protein [Rothia endophytica]|uniref:Histidine kinase n=1 Tax=Rothia endophytica TaxID=1324766 RepID=A0ABP9B023_9MICC